MLFLHLSHTDLDGYACQLVSAHYLKKLSFYNSNYGREIDEKFEMILREIDISKAKNPDEKAVIFVSDLNFTPTQCDDFSRAVRERDGVKLILLDHHASGEISAREHFWYYLDDTRCATKICYEFFSGIFGEDKKLENFVNAVNAVDIWLENDEHFEFGKVCLGAIANAKEINKVLFNDENMEYLFYLMRSFMDFSERANAHIELDNALHSIKKSFFKSKDDDTLSNLISAYLVKLLSKNKEKMSIKYRGHLGLLSSNIGNVSVVANDFLHANPEYKFYIDVTSKKTLSFRSSGDFDVSKMASELVGGGGHKNASGGFFAAFKDSFDYEKIKEQIVGLINEKTGENNA